MARIRSQPLFIGVGGHAVAINTGTGEEIWRTKLKASSFVTVHYADGRVYAGARGEIFCLDARTGALLWHNALKGLGLGVVAFPGSDAMVPLASAEAAARAATAAAS